MHLCNMPKGSGEFGASLLPLLRLCVQNSNNLILYLLTDYAVQLS